jgi:hypothetical protein
MKSKGFKVPLSMLPPQFAAVRALWKDCSYCRNKEQNIKGNEKRKRKI